MATAKKLTRAKISSLSIAGKALSENIVFERVSREAGTNFGYYFESCSLTSPVEQLESSVLFRGFVKRCSNTFFYLFSKRATGSQDKYALMQVRWYEFLREMLTSQEVCDMVKEMASGKDVVSCYLESVLIAGFKFVRERQEDSQSSRFDVTTVNMNIVEDDVSLLKLGSAAVLKLKKRLHQIARPLSKSKQSLKNIVLKEIEALERMEDLEKKNIPCFIRNLDDGNLLVVKAELLAFLRAFAKVFGSVVNQNGYSLHGRTIFKVSFTILQNSSPP